MVDYQHYQLRIHRSYDELAMSLIQFWDMSDHAFCFEHTADQEVKRTHCHAYVFNVNRSYDAISKRIKKLDLNLKGNSDFSISGTCGAKTERRPLDLSGAWCYGSKWGTIAPSFVKNISPAQVEELNEYSRRFAPKAGSNTVVTAPEPKPKQKSKYQQMKEIAELVISPEFVKITSRVERIRIVRDMTLQYLRDNQIYPGGKYKVCELIESVLMDLEDESFTRAVTLQLEKSLLPL